MVKNQSDLFVKIGGVAATEAFIVKDDELDHVIHLKGEGDLREKAKGKVLVVGRGYNFSDHLMSYSTNLACRMHLDIIALSVTNDSAYARGDLQRLAANAAAFKTRAWSKGVGFEHLIRFGAPGQAIHSICNEIGQTIYALTEPGPAEASRSADAVHPWDIQVFRIEPEATA